MMNGAGRRQGAGLAPSLACPPRACPPPPPSRPPLHPTPPRCPLQDACCAFSRYCRPTQALLAALDGHGPQGHGVSAFVKERLPLVLAEALGTGPAGSGGDPANASFSSTARSSTSGQQRASKAGGRGTQRSSSSGGGSGTAAADVAAALTATFLRLDSELRGEPSISSNYSGSTAVVCMLQVHRGAVGRQGCLERRGSALLCSPGQ